jgi:hypothetical protein
MPEFPLLRSNKEPLWSHDRNPPGIQGKIERINGTLRTQQIFVLRVAEVRTTFVLVPVATPTADTRAACSHQRCRANCGGDDAPRSPGRVGWEHEEGEVVRIGAVQRRTRGARVPFTLHKTNDRTEV